MNRTRHNIIIGILAGLFLVFSSISSAEERESYGERIGMKTAGAFANLTIGWLEIPKNVINTTNNTNVFWGFTGGTFKGIMVTLGRIGVGVTDLITFPIPTQPITRPEFVWQDFDHDTSFGPVFRLYGDDNAPPPEMTY